MNVLKKLSSVQQANKPYIGFGKLRKGYHQILSFRSVKNKFAKKGETSTKSVLIEIEDQVLFLPQNFGNSLNEKDIGDLNVLIQSGELLHLFFGGKQEEGK